MLCKSKIPTIYDMEEIKVTFDSEETMRIGVPITKVDKEKRTVSGFATLNNIDKHGDVIDSEGSLKAFEKFRGNIREMHMPIAVGKMVSFDSRTITADDGKTYEGIWVEAKISKGAEDTWEKVMDGTLSGFSIGATVGTRPEYKIDEDTGQKYRLIKEYELFELSLVDSPANPLANVFSFEKFDNGETRMTGLIADEIEKHSDPNSLTGRLNQIYDAFFRASDVRLDYDEYVVDIYEDFVLTQHGDNQYKINYNITDEGVTFGDRAEVEMNVTVTEKSQEEDSVIERFVGRLADLLENRIGGNDMTKKTDKTVEEDTKVEETEEETVEKAADVSEVEVEEETSAEEDNAEVDTDNIVNSIVEKVLERLNESVETAETDEVVNADGDEDNEEDDEEVEKSEKTESTDSDVLKEIVTALKGINDRVGNLESSTAVRKSADVDGDEEDEEDETVEKFWGNSFTGAGYYSADSL